jgi:hypothetical protein
VLKHHIELSDLQQYVYGRRDGTDNTLYYVDATVTFQPGAAELKITSVVTEKS